MANELFQFFDVLLAPYRRRYMELHFFLTFLSIRPFPRIYHVICETIIVIYVYKLIESICSGINFAYMIWNRNAGGEGARMIEMCASTALVLMIWYWRRSPIEIVECIYIAHGKCLKSEWNVVCNGITISNQDFPSAVSMWKLKSLLKDQWNANLIVNSFKKFLQISQLMHLVRSLTNCKRSAADFNEEILSESHSNDIRIDANC